MNITITELGPCRKKVQVDVPAERVREEFDKNYKELASGTAIPGFRKGKVPRQVLVRRFQEQVTGQVKATLLQELFTKILQEHKLDPVADPDLDLEKLTVTEDAAFQLSIELEVKPEFDVGAYRGLEVPGVKLELQDGEVDRAVEQLRRQRAELVPVDGQAIENGDHLIADLVLTKDGKEEQKEENVPLRVKAGERIPTFAVAYDDFVGKKVGDSLAGQATLPKSYAKKELRGQAVQWSLTVRAHQRPELPDLDDEFCEDMGCKSVDELKERVRQRLLHELEHEAQEKVEEQLVDKLDSQATFEVPEAVVERERSRLLHLEELELRKKGVPDEELAERLGAAQSEREEVVKKKVRRRLILDRVARLEAEKAEKGEPGEKLEATEAEVDELIKQLANANQMWPNEMRSRLEKSGAIDQLMDEIKMRKVRAFLRREAKVGAPSAHEQEAAPKQAPAGKKK